MDIQKFKEDFLEKINNYPKVWKKEERTLHLVEEVGEFAEIILQYNGSKNPPKNIDDIKIALADVLEDVFAISILYGIDIQDLLKEIVNEENKQERKYK